MRARYSHKSDKPTNYPKNYNILMSALTRSPVTVRVCVCFRECERERERTHRLEYFVVLRVCVPAVCVWSVYYAGSWRCAASCMQSSEDRCVSCFFVLLRHSPPLAQLWRNHKAKESTQVHWPRNKRKHSCILFFFFSLSCSLNVTFLLLFFVLTASFLLLSALCLGLCCVSSKPRVIPAARLPV